ncbi:MAG: peptidase [Pirellulaceae bacterium]|nr:peptidase [Pirellulaceae bacterium]
MTRSRSRNRLTEQSPVSVSRRQFLAATSTAVLAVHVGGGTARAHAGAASEVIIGQGEFQYRVYHQWPQLPSQYTWQTTHNVAVDSSENLYVIHEGKQELADHPSIFVFDASGKFVRAFGSQFQGGGHGLEVRREGNEEFLYVTAYQQVKSFAKLTLKGEVVWEQYAPMQSGKYAEGEAEHRQRVWGRNRFMPTNFAFLPDGGFLLADGYGSFFIHRYDANGQWLSSFGGEGKGEGTFNTPHGLWIDSRGNQPVVVVTDRAHHTLQRFTIEGKYLDTIEGFGLPANIDVQGQWMLVPELIARVSILDKNNRVVAQLGDDSQRLSADSKHAIRNDESRWLDGKFVHPHDACFAADGSIFVAEWVGRGRVSKLQKL